VDRFNLGNSAPDGERGSATALLLGRQQPPDEAVLGYEYTPVVDAKPEVPARFPGTVALAPHAGLKRPAVPKVGVGHAGDHGAGAVDDDHRALARWSGLQVAYR